jgi:hypothetical protein
MKGLLVRVGIDSTYGHWNAPVDPKTKEFVYVPIPGGDKSEILQGISTDYEEFLPPLEKFAAPRGKDVHRNLRMPRDLLNQRTHLDPDFSFLTYGDVEPRGNRVEELVAGDIIAFFAGLRPIESYKFNLLYGIIGIFVIDRVARVKDIPAQDYPMNAHTRYEGRNSGHIVAFARPGVSGRLKRCIPIGEYRQHAYRVRENLLKKWGGLGVANGYIQRSAVLPWFNDANRFYQWFQGQGALLEASNF